MTVTLSTSFTTWPVRSILRGGTDQPSLIALLTWVSRQSLGDSLPAIRFLPALAGAIEVWLAARIAGELGGGMAARSLTALAVLVAPGILAMNSFLSMNAFEPLLWLGCAIAVIRLINGDPSRTWLWFGLCAGLGLENKHSVLIFGFAVLAGLILTPERRLLRAGWFLAAGLIAGVIFLPNFLWNVDHGFPLLEIQENIRRSGRNVGLTPASFRAEEALAMNPAGAPLWRAGLWHLFFGSNRLRSLGWAWVITGALIITLNPRIYSLFPAFPILFAAGSVTCERWATGTASRRWIIPIYGTLLLTTGTLMAPVAMPLLPVETFLRYSAWLGVEQPAIETRKLGAIATILRRSVWLKGVGGDGGGSFSLAAQRNPAAHGHLRPDLWPSRSHCSFRPCPRLTQSHQRASELFSMGPGPYTGESVIVIGDSEENLQRYFTSVERAASVSHAYSMPDQHVDVFYCQAAKRSLRDYWPALKKWR